MYIASQFPVEKMRIDNLMILQTDITYCATLLCSLHMQIYQSIYFYQLSGKIFPFFFFFFATNKPKTHIFLTIITKCSVKKGKPYN